MSLRDDLRDVLHRNSAENESDTPDWILAEYLMACLYAFNEATRCRDGMKRRLSDANGR